ncbi:MAG: AMP-binding protein, partial [Gemmatimonadetes bacterium]|nr:AMP-binding protein [Gemmatimonadota bacterium]
MPEASPTASAGLVARLIGRTGGTAILDPTGAHDYATLVDASAAIATDLLRGLGDRSDLGGVRVAFLVPPGAGWAATLYGIWRAGGVAVPLALGWPAPELQHAIEETGAGTILATSELESRIADIASRLGVPRRTLQRTDELPAVLSAPPPSGRPEGLPTVPSDRAAMILFTSGTTSRPKGVVHTHGSIAAQVDTLVEAWAWSESDRLLHVLPLHHVHGIVNGLLCALASGATCDLLPEFDAETVWRAFVERPVTLFMAVPTVYARLIAAWEDAGPSDRAVRSEATARQRVMISGSAPLPVPLLERWERIAGQRLLERYGMTEIGMALSNPLEGERRPGTVGFPLPGISVRLVDESGRPVEREGEPGEIEVAGPTVFREYWRRPAATGSAFRDGWFVT